MSDRTDAVSEGDVVPPNAFPLAVTPEEGPDLRVALKEVLPTFEVGNNRSGKWVPDRCSAHGDIATDMSIARHLRKAHGMTHEQWRDLSAMAAALAIPEASSREGPLDEDRLAQLERVETAASILLTTVRAMMPERSPYGCPHSRDWLLGLLDDVRAALAPKGYFVTVEEEIELGEDV